MIAGAALAAAGMLGLLAVSPTASYPRVLPALAGIGIGIGTFTAPVVAAAISALPSARSGLASGINNTARQAGTALGVAVFGAIAGSPADSGHFVTALRALGGASALLWLAVIALTVTGIRQPGKSGAGGAGVPSEDIGVEPRARTGYGPSRS
jgi:DHA2 family methylenomycin A resistance protein-like MFS transporter